MAYTNKCGVVCQSAESFGYRKGLYDVSGQPDLTPGISTVDHWQYEDELPGVLDGLAAGERLLLSDWLHVAVPFIAALFSRGIDYNERYHDRIDSISSSLEWFSGQNDREAWERDWTNISRVIEMLSLLLPVMAARWKVIHAVGSYGLVINDLGAAPVYDPASRLNGWIVPLDSATALMILPNKFRCFASYAFDGNWYTPIEHLYEQDDFFEGLNESLACSASCFIAGQDCSEVERLSTSLSYKEPRELIWLRENSWNNRRGISVAADDLVRWAFAVAVADKGVPPHILPEYHFDMKDINSVRWVPWMVPLKAPDKDGSCGNGEITFLGRNMFVGKMTLSSFGECSSCR